MNHKNTHHHKKTKQNKTKHTHTHTHTHKKTNLPQKPEVEGQEGVLEY